MRSSCWTVQPRPTAVFAANNLIGIGALQSHCRMPDCACRKIWRWLAFDDLPPTLLTFPFFTVAVQPAYEMGKSATQLLLARLTNPIAELSGNCSAH